MITTENAVVLAFLITNAGRVLAYLPQIVAIARDRNRAAAVSCATWSLFFVSNLASALYAGIITTDVAMMIAFAAHTVGCAAIVGVLCWKRAARPTSTARRG